MVPIIPFLVMNLSSDFGNTIDNKKLEDILTEKLGALSKIINKLKSVSPLVTPSNPDKDNS